MAIELPRASPSSLGTASRSPRKSGPVIDAGDVPRQETALDPGLVIPDLGGPGRALEGFGGAVSEVGDRFAEVAERARTRADAVDRARVVSSYNESQAAELRRIQTEADLSSEDVPQAYMKAGQAALQEALEAHTGSKDSKARLAIRLEAIRSGYADRVSILGSQAGFARVGQAMGASLNQLTASVHDDPGGLAAAFDALDAAIDDMAPALTVEQELDFQSAGREVIAARAVESFLDRGMFAEAKELMQNTPGLIEIMSPETQRRLTGRIAQFQRAQFEAENEARRKVATAETILGRRATPVERAKLAGLAPAAGPQTVSDKIREIETAIGRPLTERERANAVGLDTPQAVSPEGKLVQDRELFISQFGEGSEQVAAFDEAVRGAGDAPSLSDVAGQRKEFTKASAVFVSVRGSFNRVVSSAQDPSAAGDLAMIFNFMKILDPGSVVRESEFAQAAATGSWGERLQAAAARFLAGERLSEDMRADFAERAELLMQAQLRTHLQLEAQFRALAQRTGFNPDDVVLDYIGPLRAMFPGAAAASTGQGAPARAVPRLKFDLNGNLLGSQ